MQLFANNTYSVLSDAIDNVTTVIEVASGASFPSPTGDDFFLVTLIGLDVNLNETVWEIVKVTGRTGNVLTVVRGQDGTSAQAWPSATRVELRITAGTMAAKQETLVSGTNLKTVNSGSLLGSGNLAVGDVTLAGTQTLTNKTLDTPTVNAGYTEQVHALSGATPALSVTGGSIKTWALSAASTPTDGLSAGQSLTLMITNPTEYVVTWPAMQWAGGAAPSLPAVGSAVIVLWKVGATLYGLSAGVVHA